MISVGVLIANEPLPGLGIPPQEVLFNIIRTVVNAAARDPNKDSNKEKSVTSKEKK
jgi:hypothetical protein